MAKFCPDCGHPIIDNNMPFCPKCGTKLPITSSESKSPTNQPSIVQQPTQPLESLPYADPLPVTISELLQSANNLSKSERYSEALPILKSVLTLDPNNAIAWNAKGDALDGLGKHQEALDAYNKAIFLNPKLAQAWSDKGCVFCKLGKYNEALDACNQALSINPNFEDGWTKKGCALLKLGRYQEALHACNQALSIDPNSVKAKENKDAALKNLELSTKSSFRSTVLKSGPKKKNDYWKYVGYLLGAFVIIILFHSGINNQTTTSQPTLQPTPTIDSNTQSSADLAAIIAPSTPQSIPTIDSTADEMKNKASTFSRAIDYTNPTTRDFALELIKNTDSGPTEKVGLNQICDIWDAVRPPHWTYVNDPLGQDYYSPASRTINLGLKGDCDDFAVLNAAVAQSINIPSRVITACSPDEKSCHAYAEAFISNDYYNLQSTTDYLRDRYGISTVYYHSYVDSSGNTGYWLNLDWWANYPGGPFFQDDGTYEIFYPNGAYDTVSNSGSTIVALTPTPHVLNYPTTAPVLHCYQTLKGLVCK